MLLKQVFLYLYSRAPLESDALTFMIKLAASRMSTGISHFSPIRGRFLIDNLKLVKKRSSQATVLLSMNIFDDFWMSV